MTREEIGNLLSKQKAFFNSGKTLPLEFRKTQLKKLYSVIKKYEAEIAAALYYDLQKSEYESYMCEIGLVLSEITYMLRHINKFAKPKKVKTPIAQFPSKSRIVPMPYGNALIMSPWNYPFLLTLDPLVNAIAAGNTAVVKPSAYSPETCKVVEKIISECFAPEFVAVVSGGRNENSALLDQKFDVVFFTGSQAVGKEVLRRCAENLTPSILELGGKSPCIVDKSADVELAARRIVFGKFLNCGQTCVAPDYILCEREVKDKFVSEVIKQIKLQYGDAPLENKDYGKIINEKHFNRLLGLIEKEKVVFGGESDSKTQRIAPTVLDNVSENDAVMGEEIFGPIMPIIAFDDFEKTVFSLKEKAKPLALYIFSADKKHIKLVTETISYGGGCINDVIIHLATSEMGFGGVGESGMGAYHGKEGFFAFSHQKSIVDKKLWLDLPMRYQPFKSELNKKLLRAFLK